MTAIRAQSASETSTTTAEPATVSVWLQGSRWTYQMREVLREMGLRWDSVAHAWHGTVSVLQKRVLDAEGGGPLSKVVPLEAFAGAVLPSGSEGPSAAPLCTTIPATRVLTRDGSRTCLEARIASPVGGDDADGSGQRAVRGKYRTIPMEPMTRAVLEKWVSGKGIDECLYPVGHTVADGELAELGRTAAISVRVTGHVLPRSFGRLAYQAGVPVPTIQRIFGYVSVDQTLHYIGAGEEEMTEGFVVFDTHIRAGMGALPVTP